MKPKKTQQIQYLYPYRRFKIMVGHIEPKSKTSDYYYLNRWQTFKYLFTGHLPHEGLSGKWIKDMNAGKITPKKEDK